jgi:ketosteroid isomerase-like protein
MTVPVVPTAAELIAMVEAYFEGVDRDDLDATLAGMTPDCVLDYKTMGVQYVGRDQGIRNYFIERRANLVHGWHGNCSHTVDVTNGRVATRFELRRTDKDKPAIVNDNLNLFQFEGGKIKRIWVWRGEMESTVKNGG